MPDHLSLFYICRTEFALHHLPRSHCEYDGLHVFRHHLLCDDDHAGTGQHGTVPGFLSFQADFPLGLDDCLSLVFSSVA